MRNRTLCNPWNFIGVEENEMIRLRNVKLAAKFVLQDVPGVWKKVSSNKARCVFGPKEDYGKEITTTPDSEVFVLDEERLPLREKPRIEPPPGNDMVKVVFEDCNNVAILERLVPLSKAAILARADIVAVRPASRRRKELWQIGDVGFDLEGDELLLEVMGRHAYPTKRERGENDTDTGKVTREPTRDV